MKDRNLLLIVVDWLLIVVAVRHRLFWVVWQLVQEVATILC